MILESMSKHSSTETSSALSAEPQDTKGDVRKRRSRTNSLRGLVDVGDTVPAYATNLGNGSLVAPVVLQTCPIIRSTLTHVAAEIQLGTNAQEQKAESEIAGAQIPICHFPIHMASTTAHGDYHRQWVSRKSI